MALKALTVTIDKVYRDCREDLSVEFQWLTLLHGRSRAREWKLRSISSYSFDAPTGDDRENG